MPGPAAVGRDIVVDPFCFRQFNDDPDYTGAKVSLSIGEFEAEINKLYQPDLLVDGYAPFCKHLFVPNFAKVKESIVAITPENKHLLRTEYEARTEKELPILMRYFPAELMGTVGPAAYLDIILYSREQIRKENAAMGDESSEDAPWGIVSIKPQSVNSELPMQPITMMRNALGEEYGGSGVALDEAAYRASVAFWEKHAPLK